MRINKIGNNYPTRMKKPSTSQSTFRPAQCLLPSVLALLASIFLALPSFGTVPTDSARWVWQNPLPQGNDLRGASFVDANTGTVVGFYGTIVRTTDGGSSWTIQSGGTTENLWAVSFSDTNNGTAVG